MAANKVSIDLELKGDKLVERGLKNVGDAADKAGSEFEGMAKDAGQLTKKISETKAEIDKLTKAFNETGDMSLLKSIRKEKSNLRALEGLLPKPSEIAAEAAKVGTETGLALNQSLTKSLMASKGLIIPPLVAAALMAAPIMGAAISSAVVGAAGAGGMIGGIVAASQDQRVQDAAKMVGDRVGDAFVDAGKFFVNPLIESLRILDDAGDRLADNFGQIGAKLGPILPTLTGGLAGMVEKMMPGIVRAMETAKPVLRALSAELPKIGDAISDFFDKISDDPDQAVMGIIAISQAVQGAIDAAGDLLSALGDVFEWSARNGAAMSETWEAMFGWLPVAGDHIRNVGAGFREQVAAIDAANNAAGDFTDDGLSPIIRAEEEVEKVTKTATEAIEAQTAAMDKMFGRFMDSREVARNYQEAIDDLTESVAKNGTSLDEGSEAGRANAEALDNLATKIKDTRENTILMTGDVEGANAAYLQQVEALRQQALKLGLSKQAADDLAAGLRDIPRQVDVEVRAPGLLEVIARAEYLRRLLGSNAAAARSNPITINGQFHPGDDSGYGGGRASGGPVQPGMLYTVGENGPELLQMGASGGYVHNASASKAMMSGASGGSSMGRPVVSITYAASGNAAMDAFIQMIWPFVLKQVRIDGGDLSAFGAA